MLAQNSGKLMRLDAVGQSQTHHRQTHGLGWSQHRRSLMVRVAQLSQLRQIQTRDAANAMPSPRKLFEQERLGHIVLGKQALVALGLDGGECAITGLPDAQSGDRNLGGLGDGADAVER